MNAARDESACLRLECWLSAYVDDELDAVHCLEVEDHLGSCEECAERSSHLRATRSSLQGLSAKAPSGMRARMAKLIDSLPEAQDEAVVSPPVGPTSLDAAAVDMLSKETAEPATGTASAPPPSSLSLARLRLIVPLAAAATIALVFGAIELQKHEAAGTAAGSSAPSYSSAVNRVASLDGLVDELVQQHIQSPPLDTTDPTRLNEYERQVGVRVREPYFHDAKWMGARVQPESRAAMMRYLLKNQHRITVYVFDSNRVNMTSRRLVSRSSPASVPQHRAASTVFVGNVRGYTVAAAERDGVGYALASDLSGDETAKLLVAAATH